MFIRAAFFFWMVVLLFNGCTRGGAPRLESKVEIPAVYFANAELPGSSNNFEHWWQSFGSKELEAFVTQVLTNNPQIEVAAARVEQAEALARIAGAERLPDLGASFDARRQQQNFIGLPIPGAPGQVLTARSTSYGVSLVSNWELDLWGRIRAGHRGALREGEAAMADFEGMRTSLTGQAVKSWLAAAEAMKQYDLSRLTSSNLHNSRFEIEERYQRGLRSPLEVRLAAAAEANAEAMAAMRSNQVQSVLKQLNVLAGEYPSGKIEGQPLLGELPEVPAGVPGELLERRPDLVSARKRVEAAVARKEEAQLARLPRIALTVSGGRSSDELADLVSNNFNVWALAANVAQPIFEGGRLKANVSLNKAKEREAFARYVATALQAFGEVETILGAEQQMVVGEKQLTLAYEHSQAALRLAEDRYRSGLEAYVTLLEAQRRAWESESQLISHRSERLENRVDLFIALGGSVTNNVLETSSRK